MPTATSSSLLHDDGIGGYDRRRHRDWVEHASWRGEDEAMSGEVGPWIVGGVMALLALLGLGLASGAADDVIYGTGLGLFAFGVLFIFFLIHRHVGR
jgi:hypothetical protein